MITANRQISKRICNESSNVESVNLQPILLSKPEMNTLQCSSNCSGQGYCIGDNSCICNSEYTGSITMAYVQLSKRLHSLPPSDIFYTYIHI